MEQDTIQSLLQKSTGYLTRQGAESPRLLSEMLLASVLKQDRVYLFSHFDEPLNEEEVTAFREMIKRAAAKEPASYITGHKEFMSLDFAVTPDVLIPRPDTEVMVEEALRLIKKHGYTKIADIGTGSGCIPVSLLKYSTDALQVKAVDLSEGALKVAEQNAEAHALKISFYQGSLLEPLIKEDFKADLITANLPYVPLETYQKLDATVRDYEPRMALTDEADGLNLYRELLRQLPKVLSETGRLLLEIDPRQKDALQFIEEAGYQYRIMNDLAGRARLVIAAKKGLSEEEPKRSGTLMLRVNPEKPEEEILKTAAEAVIRGELVAFPTETVYGLAAAYNQPNALDAIFVVKERPQESPLLVALSDPKQLKLITDEIPAAAEKLMAAFWPGPLSLVFKGKDELPEQVKNANGGVGVRMPSDDVARALIRLSGPISAPSANRHGRPSPLTAEDVKADLDGKIPYIIDAGPTKGGVESTIVDCTVSPVRLLRQGAISHDELEAVLGEEVFFEAKQEASYKLAYSVFACPSQENFEQKRAILRHFSRPYGVLSFDDYTDPEALFMAVLTPEKSAAEFFRLLREAEKSAIKTLLIRPFAEVAARYPEGLRQRVERLMKPKEEKA